MVRLFLTMVLSTGCFFAFAQKKAGNKRFADRPVQRSGAVLMPFNRWVQSAGQEIRFGDSSLENHSLDITPLPGNTHLVIEDRYGIAVLDAKNRRIADRWTFNGDRQYGDFLSTYSGIKSFQYRGQAYIVWGAAGKSNHKSALMVASWSQGRIKNVEAILLEPQVAGATGLPNDVFVNMENGTPSLYAVLNGNDRLVKLDFLSRGVIWSAPTGVAPFGIEIVGDKAYVTNWAGPQVTDTLQENAGVPWGRAYTNPATGATARGSLSIIDIITGKPAGELPLGLHPNAIKASRDRRHLYISNGNSDYISVVDISREMVVDSIHIGLFSAGVKYYGSSPNALQTDLSGRILFVANGLDNALCVVRLGEAVFAGGKGKSFIKGYIPAGAYPGGIAVLDNTLYVANIEARGAGVLTNANGLNEELHTSQSQPPKAYTIHQQLATVSIIPIPSEKELIGYTRQVKRQNYLDRIVSSRLAPRKNCKPLPVPERIGEPSLFRHVVYIIKENKTYDQVFGDIPDTRGMPQLCVYGDSITPNQHSLARTFSVLDNYYASGKSSAEGHQWTDAAMVSDYIEKSVRAWFRSYPHRQEDALVYNKSGFIWNNALDHGKKVRIYGEACLTHYDKSMKWEDFYNAHLGKQRQNLYNTTTIARIRPVIAPGYPDCDNLVFPDQLRADVFIDEWKKYEAATVDSLPDLMVLSLPNDHTAGMSPGFPVPRAMVADNDLALGRIVDVITHSRYWDSTVVFVTEDDSQSGWDHISPYRTTGLVISPYSVLGKVIHTNYNQTSMVRTIEQILGIPPMNVIDATALPMYDCFSGTKKSYAYAHVPNRVPLNNMNQPMSSLKGKSLYYARQSAENVFKDVDGGQDNLMNRILWFDARGNEAYPGITGNRKHSSAKD